MQYGSTSEQLKAYNVMTVPPKDEWVNLGPELKFMEGLSSDEEGEKENKISKKTIVFNFSSSAANGGEVIDKYIKGAFDWYIEQVDHAVDNCRYSKFPPLGNKT